MDVRPNNGVTLIPGGARFALSAPLATSVELCLFDAEDRESRAAMRAHDSFWSLDVDGVGPGQRYGFRVNGPWDPPAGHRSDHAALLLDPYARAIDGDVSPHDAVYAHELGVETAPFVPRSVVVDTAFDWAADERPDVAPDARVIYEAHVRGLTMRHPEVPEALRGTFAGIAHPAVIEHIVSLGITSLELMPVHHFNHGRFLHERGLRNYWGYDTIGFFAPHAEYATERGGGQVAEFKAMVRDLHAAGLEVILDVVYNHTAEGDRRGPTLHFRGIDEGGSYLTHAGDPGRLLDVTGTGNTVDMRTPRMRELVLDSLRYWVDEMHVDGFRFDLTVALARMDDGFAPDAPFLEAVGGDPVLRETLLIAEPWDIGPDGYRVGGFPAPWAEWNGRYRDSIRDVWRGAPDALSDFGRRFSGSEDLFGGPGRSPASSVNFVTAHDGFTLTDLVSYELKHNDANGEDGADGESHNRSWNGGTEGPTDDRAINASRARQRRNLLATLLLSQGTPMLLAGDELGRTQQGNNNAYCQDNEISWLDWDAADASLLAFVRHLIAVRNDHPQLRSHTWLHPLEDSPDSAGLGWSRPDGQALDADDWHADESAIGVSLVGDERLFIALNATPSSVEFRLPDAGPWRVALDTAVEAPIEPAPPAAPAGLATRVLEPRSLALFVGER